MKYVKNKKYLPILIAVFVVVIGALFLFRGGSAPTLIGTEINMTRLVRGSDVSPNGFFSVPFLKDSEEYTFINIAVDLDKDGAIGSYIVGGETQEEWLVRNMRARALVSEANNYSILIPDKTIEERNDFSAYIALGKNELSSWDEHSASGGLLKEAKIFELERIDYGPYYSPDPEGIRSGGFPLNWLVPSYAFADNSIPNAPPGAGTGAGAGGGTTFNEFHSEVPDLNQETNECVPTSAVNSLLWLAGKYDFSDKLPAGGSTELISELKYDMKWNDNGVNVPANFILGKNAFTSRHKIPIETHQVGGQFDTGIVGKIAEELKKGNDVEIDLEYGIYSADGSYSRGGGHMVTVVGAWTAGGSEFLDIHDPLSRGLGTLDIYKINGTRVVNYGFQGTAVTYIRYAFAESPQSEDQVTPSVKIDSAKATLKKVEHYSGGDTYTCTVELSGTITGPECSFLSMLSGTHEVGGLLDIGGAKGCPDWTYWGTSGICVRNLKQPATTKWSMTFDQTTYWGKRDMQFTVELSIPKLPLVNISGGNICATAETGNQLFDSVSLTCD